MDRTRQIAICIAFRSRAFMEKRTYFCNQMASKGKQDQLPASVSPCSHFFWGSTACGSPILSGQLAISNLSVRWPWRRSARAILVAAFISSRLP